MDSIPTFLRNGALGESKGEMEVFCPNIRMGNTAEIEVPTRRGLKVDVLDFESSGSLPEKPCPNDSTRRSKQSRLAMLGKIHVPHSLEPHEAIGLLCGEMPQELNKHPMLAQAPAAASCPPRELGWI